MEINKRAIEIAELVLWIGYLQWHLRTRPDRPAEPVLGNSDHIVECNALLTWEGFPTAPARQLRSRKSKSIYFSADVRMPPWPDADFIVGNPPFIGGKDIRERLGGDYAEALWQVYSHVNSSADYVMYWWDRAAEILTRKGTRLRRFGLVTTNSVTQVFQRRIIEHRLKAERPISIVFAIPDHPWTKASPDAAAVRIAMTVAEIGEREGILREVNREDRIDTDEPIISFVERKGSINADLTIGADLTRVKPLVANDALCSPGVKLHGAGFIVSPTEASRLGLGKIPGLNRHIRHYRNGRDLMAKPRGAMVIDLDGLTSADVRTRYPAVYQHLLAKVKSERDRNNEEYRRTHWWLFGRKNTVMRSFVDGLNRYIVTVETAKHRVFQFLDASILPDNMLVAIGSDDAYHLGVLSSRVHVVWALRAGGWLGVGNDPRYSKSRCFDPFPFPDTSAATKRRIAKLADELDALRKSTLAKHADITLTALYNVLEEIRSGLSLSEKNQDIKDRGHVLIMKDLHEQIDALVFEAYGWAVDINDNEISANLATLNEERTKEEARGLIRWLRPAYQIDKLGALAHRADKVQEISVGVRSRTKHAFPQEPREQAGQILLLLRRSPKPLTAEEIAAAFTEGHKILVDVKDILQSFSRLGDASSFDNGISYVAQSA